MFLKDKKNIDCYDLSSVLGESWSIPTINNKKNNNIKVFFKKIQLAIKTMSDKSYWTKANIVEAWGFTTKIAIIFPGLLFGTQFWWLYVFAIMSSIALIWSSTVKTLPTIILFNVCWVILASIAILKHFF